MARPMVPVAPKTITRLARADMLAAVSVSFMDPHYALATEREEVLVSKVTIGRRVLWGHPFSIRKPGFVIGRGDAGVPVMPVLDSGPLPGSFPVVQAQQIAEKSRNPGSILRQAQDEASDINGLHVMGSLSRFGWLTVRPWAASFFSNLLD